MKKLIRLSFTGLIFILFGSISFAQTVPYSKAQTRALIHDSLDALRETGIGGETTIDTTDLDAIGGKMLTDYEASLLYLLKTEKQPLYSTCVDSSLQLTTLKFPLGRTTKSTVIDTIIYIMVGGDGSNSVTPKLFYGTDISATGTAVITSPSAVTSSATETKVSTFNNATIPKGNMIWLTFSAVGSCVRFFMVEVIGH